MGLWLSRQAIYVACYILGWAQAHLSPIKTTKQSPCRVPPVDGNDSTAILPGRGSCHAIHSKSTDFSNTAGMEIQRVKKTLNWLRYDSLLGPAWNMCGLRDAMAVALETWHIAWLVRSFRSSFRKRQWWHKKETPKQSKTYYLKHSKTRLQLEIVLLYCVWFEELELGEDIQTGRKSGPREDVARCTS